MVPCILPSAMAMLNLSEMATRPTWSEYRIRACNMVTEILQYSTVSPAVPLGSQWEFSYCWLVGWVTSLTLYNPGKNTSKTNKKSVLKEKTSFTDWFRKFHNIQYIRNFCHFWRFFLENFPYKRRFAYAAVRYFGAFLKKCIVFMYDFCLLLLALHMYIFCLHYVLNFLKYCV